MRKLLLLILFAFCASISMFAQDFKILFLNTETIRVGEKNLAVGDCFYKSETIHWSDAKQAMEVLSLQDNNQYVFASPDFKKRKMKSAQDFLVKSNRLSTRGSGSISSVARKLSDTIYAIDTTMIPVDYIPDESEYFYVMKMDRRFVLEFKDNHLIFSHEIWSENEPVEVDLFYHFADGEEECIKEGIQIIPLPKELKKVKKKKRFLFF